MSRPGEISTWRPGEGRPLCAAIMVSTTAMLPPAESPTMAMSAAAVSRSMSR